ncbi:CdaR family transcriptional regulator [Conexibacter sp. DBS9H8]|uniref:PucR family transcriptional regulator n=1 Tax=Conexibacter sp. DBS9H8 TaxID=2937801 RepID=UPI0020103560|nr:helix-turn-helix domain-containing protein [Conexibacter sp. DBS9H8]
MSVSVGDPGPVARSEALARLSQLAEAVREAAEQLQLSATAVAGGTSGRPGSEAAPGGAASLIDDLLEHARLEEGEVIRRAAELGCDLSLGAQALCVELSVRRPAYVTAIIADGCQEVLVHSRIGEPVRLYAVLPCTGSCIAGSLGAVRALAGRIAPYGLVGISSYQSDPADLGRALREAELVLELVRSSGQRVVEEIGSGTYRLLLRMLAADPTGLRDFHDQIVAPLLAYDARQETELVSTLCAYFDADCNMNATAERLRAHRHTVAARLDRIFSLTGLNPIHYADREQLGLALKVHRLLNPLLAAGDGAAGRA